MTEEYNVVVERLVDPTVAKNVAYCVVVLFIVAMVVSNVVVVDLDVIAEVEKFVGDNVSFVVLVP